MSEVTIEGLDRLAALIDDKVKWLESIVPIIQDECENGSHEMKSIVQIRSGFTRDNIEYSDLDDGAQVWSKSPYSQIIEYGSTPHIIMPRFAKALHWVDAMGKDVFAKLVHHPGTRPYPYFHPVVDVISIRIRQDIVESW